MNQNPVSPRFVASISVCQSDIRKLRQHAQLADVGYDLFRDILITPLFVGPDSLLRAQEMADEGSNVYFDSGGYHVQMGRLRFDDLYLPLLKIYKANPWAARYTLPDHVPLSSDSPEQAERKVNDTISFSTMFFHELPDELKSRAMPVIQGRNHRQVDACLEAYINLGVTWMGFGSFGTMGSKSEVNVATQASVDLAKYVIKVAHAHGIKVHLFGLGAPPLVAMIKGINADSFDSASWLKAAGFGMVSLPLMRFYNISHRSAVAEFQRGVTLEEFQELRRMTGHDCQLCNDLLRLQTRKMYRAVHNLVVLHESVSLVSSNDLSLARAIYENGSVKYRKEYERWLSA